MQLDTRIGRALYDYNNDPQVEKEVNLANDVLTKAILSSALANSQISGRTTAAVGAIIYGGGIGSLGNILALTGGALRGSHFGGEIGGRSADVLSNIIQGAIGAPH